MKGEILRKIISDSGIKLKTIAKDSGIPEQTIYSLYKKKEIGGYYLERLANTGLGKYINNYKVDKAGTINEVSDHPVEYKEPGNDLVRFLTETVQVMKEMMSKSDKQSEIIQQMAASLTSTNDHVRGEALYYREKLTRAEKMIQDGYDAGLLSWKK